MNMPKSGIVTVTNWTLAPNGGRYLYFYCSDWQIITDNEMPIEKFRSTEKWQLIANVNDKVIALFPGCQVKAFIALDEPPAFNDCYNFI